MFNVQQNFGQILPGGELTNYEVTRDSSSGSAQFASSIPVVGTVHSDIFKGQYLGRPCALKVYRNLQDPELVRKVCTTCMTSHNLGIPDTISTAFSKRSRYVEQGL